MKIKKYHNDSAPTNTAHQLEAYGRQAQQYRRPNTPLSTDALDWRKGVLAALIPFAAATTADAQCQGAANGGNAITLVNGQSFLLDVDGDGANDLKFLMDGYRWRCQPLNGFNALNTAGGLKLVPLGSNQVVERGLSNFAPPNAAVLYYHYYGNGGARGNFGVGTTSFLPVLKGNTSTGLPGWAKIEVLSYHKPTQTVSFKILERGVESPTNSSLNSAITGDCASMAAGVLSVEMTGFAVKSIQNNLVLAWTTAQERDNDGFEIQRSSDGRNFQKIGWTKGNGTTSKASDYQFTDDQADPNRTYYYRLRQLDHNGKATLSAVVSGLWRDGAKTVVNDVFPNPSRRGQGFTVEVVAPKSQTAQVQVFDSRGALVDSLKLDVSEGANQLRVPMQDAAAGMYFVKIETGGERFYKKLVVK